MKPSSKYQWFLFVCFAVSLILSLIQTLGNFPDPDDEFAKRGAYSPELNTLKNIDSFLEKVDNAVTEKNYSWMDTARVVSVIDSLVRHRFYHGSARRSMNNDYLATILGKFLWDDLRIVTEPNEILNHRVAVCNQTNIVLQAILANYGFRYRTIGLNNHQLTEVYYRNGWHIHDCDYEPEFESLYPPSTEELLSDPQQFREAYKHVDSMNYNATYSKFISSSQPVILQEGGKLGSNMDIAQQTTKIYSQYGWGLWLLLLVISKLWGARRN